MFLAQSFGNSFAQYRQSYAFAAARPVLQATNASSKFQVSFQASKFDLLLVPTRLVLKRRYSTRIRLRRGSCLRNMAYVYGVVLVVLAVSSARDEHLSRRDECGGVTCACTCPKRRNINVVI